MFSRYHLMIKTLLSKSINKNYFEEQIGLLHQESHYCLLSSTHKFLKSKDNNAYISRRCLKSIRLRNQKKIPMLRYFEQEACNISFMHPSQKKNKFKDWYIKKDLRMWIAADFECMNVPIIDNYNDNKDDNVSDT